MTFYIVLSGYFLDTSCQPSSFMTTHAPPMNQSCMPQDDCDGHTECVIVNGTLQLQCLNGWTGNDCRDRDVTGIDPQCLLDAGCKNGGTCFNQSCCCLPGYVIGISIRPTSGITTIIKTNNTFAPPDAQAARTISQNTSTETL